MRIVKHTYAPRGAARTLLESRAGEVLLSGPAGTGKSRACLEKLNLVALKYPGMRGLIVRKTAVSLGASALVTWREKVAAEGLSTGLLHWYGGSQQEAAGYRYDNGSIINVGGMDNPTKIMSTEYDVAYVQEAVELTKNDWEAITSRLRNGRMPYQQLIADTNPDRREHWLKKRADEGITQMLESRHEDNPVYFNEDGTMTDAGRAYIEGKLDRLSGVRYWRLRKGLWVSAEGVIYEEWDPAIHLIDRFEIPDTWERWWTVDFGYTNPFVLQCWAEDGDGNLYLYREIYHTQRLVEDHARMILDVVAPLDESGRRSWIERKPRAIICDHDAEDRATLERHLQLGTVAAVKTVSDGLQAVQGRLRPGQTGTPRLRLLRDSLLERDPELDDAKLPASTQEEIPGYVWSNSKTKEQPLKENDHGCDAMRYLVAYRDLKGTPRVRFMP